MAYNTPAMYPSINVSAGPAPAAAAPAPVDVATLIGALMPVLGSLASKVATYVMLNKDPSSITFGDTALLLEAGSNDKQLVNAIAAGENPQDVLVRALSQDTFRTLQLGAVTKALTELGKAMNKAQGNVGDLVTELNKTEVDGKPSYPNFFKFINP